MTRLILTLASVLAAIAAHAQDTKPDLLLANKFGELCTMCVGTLKCTATETGATTTFAFQKKTWFGQMMTIFDFVPGLGKGPWETRPVVISQSQADGAATSRIDEGRLSIKEARIEAGGTMIDRTTGAWSNSNGAALGTCIWTDPNPAAKTSAAP